MKELQNMDTIVCDFMGRLGNQMFTYAYVRQLKELSHKNTRIVFNFSRCKEAGDAKDGFINSLKYFQIMPYEESEENLVLHESSPLQRIAYILYQLCYHKLPRGRFRGKVLAWVSKKIERVGLHFTVGSDSAREPGGMKYPKHFVRGVFQDEANFKDIRIILLKEFTPINKPLESNAYLYRIINQPDSVCVSIRRGDFLSSNLKDFFYVCTPEYYYQAIALIRSRVEHPKFIFFSDEIEWVRKNINIEDCECYYEGGDDPVWEKLRLMYSCHHFIISNSTFSWWAQYLGQREGKIVVSPSKWYAHPDWHSNLISESFCKIETSIGK